MLRRGLGVRSGGALQLAMSALLLLLLSAAAIAHAKIGRQFARREERPLRSAFATA